MDQESARLLRDGRLYPCGGCTTRLKDSESSEAGGSAVLAQRPTESRATVPLPAALALLLAMTALESRASDDVHYRVRCREATEVGILLP